MHIWRIRTRRDRGKHATDGEEDWGAPRGAANFSKDDDLLQHKQQTAHIEHFHHAVHRSMHEYLNTLDGKKEIRLLITNTPLMPWAEKNLKLEKPNAPFYLLTEK